MTKMGYSRPVRAFPGAETAVAPGASRDYMALPQTMFAVLSRKLRGIRPDEADGVHGPASAANVRWLQRAAGQRPTGVMDQGAWDALCRLYEVFVVLETGQEFSGGWG